MSKRASRAGKTRESANKGICAVKRHVAKEVRAGSSSGSECSFSLAIASCSWYGTNTKSALQIEMWELPLARPSRTHDLLTVFEHLDELRQLWLSALALRSQDGSIQLASRLESLTRRKQFSNMGRSGERPSSGNTCSFWHVKCEQRHRAFQLGQEIGMLFPSRRELFCCKRQRFVDETTSDELDQSLLLKVEEEEWVVVQDLQRREKQERGVSVPRFKAAASLAAAASSDHQECAMASQISYKFGVKNYPHIDSHWSPLLSVVHEKVCRHSRRLGEVIAVAWLRIP